MIRGSFQAKARTRFFTGLAGAFIFLLFFQDPAQAQFSLDHHCQLAYQSIISLRFEAGKAEIALSRKEDPGNLFPVYLENYMDFLAVFIGEDATLFEKFRKDHDKRIALLEKGRDDSPYYRYCIASVRLQWAVTRLKFGEYISAASDMTSAYKSLNENAGKYPGFLPDNTGLGVIHILAGVVPDNYKWLSRLVGLKGDIQQGLKELASVASYAGADSVYRLFRPEALYFLSIVDASLGKDKKESLKIIRDLGNDPSLASNPVVIYAKASILMKNGLNDEAISTLQSYQAGPGSFPFAYLDYMLGTARLDRQDADADRYLIRFLKDFGGKNYIKSGYQKLAWSYLLKGNRQKYNETIAMTLTRGAAIIEPDRQAMNEAKKGEIPNVTLLKARLLFDGGYYNRALDELLNRKLSDFIVTKKDLLEYNYRLGRIYHESGNTAKALQYYDLAIASGKDQPWYFATNAALQAGLICEKRGDLVRARKYFELCLSMDPEEYKNSLHQRAKAALKRIGDQ